ncbi:uncharacterized protein LOC127789551 [Diospyros lotus]|uniref:uncharacterized protein LOC127789551 n=1 Tax=Diospyros lotus TaxID=55363 RepID=UPI002258DBFC|nr:uncharacterized protein LOC127789551 [Diospyros lotus]
MALLSVALSLSSSSSTAALGVAPPLTAASRPAPHIGSRQPSALLMPPLPLRRRTAIARGSRRRKPEVVCMAPEEEKMTRRSPLDFPIEWDRPKPGRRPDIFPQFSPMKTPLPPPLPADPPEEDEEEEEKKEEEEEDPEKEEPEKPETQ